MTTEEIAREIARLVALAGQGAADLVRSEDERWKRGAEMVLTEGVEAVDCCPKNMAAGLVVQPVNRSLRSREVRRLRFDHSVEWLPVDYCPFCGVYLEPPPDEPAA